MFCRKARLTKRRKKNKQNYDSKCPAHNIANDTVIYFILIHVIFNFRMQTFITVHAHYFRFIFLLFRMNDFSLNFGLIAWIVVRPIACWWTYFDLHGRNDCINISSDECTMVHRNALCNFQTKGTNTFTHSLSISLVRLPVRPLASIQQTACTSWMHLYFCWL